MSPLTCELPAGRVSSGGSLCFPAGCNCGYVESGVQVFVPYSGCRCHEWWWETEDPLAESIFKLLARSGMIPLCLYPASRHDPDIKDAPETAGGMGLAYLGRDEPTIVSTLEASAGRTRQRAISCSGGVPQLFSG